jgi:hypothetical protein
MALIPIIVDRTSKPPIGTPLRSDGHWSVQGLVGAKPFNSTVDDVTKNLGVASGATQGVDGYHFANAGDRITWTTTTADSLSGNFSILFSVLVDAVPGGYQSIIARDDYDQRIILTGMDYGSGQYVLCQFGASFTPSLPAGDHRYKRLPFAYTASSVDGQKAYAYGSLIGSDAYTSAIFNGSSTVIGDKGTTWPLKGTLAYLFIYSRALNAIQIKAITDNPWQIYEPETVWINVENGTLNQYSFRFLNDDGSESAATFAGAENANVNLSAGDILRLRYLIDATGDPTGKQFQLEFRRKPSGGSFGDWKPVN